MDDLVRWLGAQLDEDERTARQATEGPWIAEVSGETGNCVIPADAQSTREYVARTQLYAAVFDAEHIAEWDPARVLREIDTKRRILAEIVPRMNEMDEQIHSEWGSSYDPIDYESKSLLRLLALPYANRPGYREAWRP